MALLLELQAGSSRAFGERADPPVVLEPGAVEDDALDAGCPGTLADELADLAGPLGLGAPAPRRDGLHRGGAGEGVPAGIVDDLGVDLVDAAEDRQAWSLAQTPPPEGGAANDASGGRWCG